ncbi:RES family NAD+ phosphorylase [Pinirhizobacter sp.]|jgi:RES domain-containing protein|uniref:RES family NAD+ phosphorylase n=1 Tax=Pinirhizobacter sp. TaxID=2950432 RepID=UPI002F3F5E7D
MRLWRISAFPGLTGEGGLYDDGRWHTKGRRIVYTAEHPALAMIETLAHMRLPLTDIPLTLQLIRIEVLDDAAIDPQPNMPSGWQANDVTTRAIGDGWLKSKSSLLLPVPSSLIADATNYLVNPDHPQRATCLVESKPEPFWFDKRYLR